MVRRTSTVRRRGLTAYKLVELLTGKIRYPMRYYDGYGRGLEGGGNDDLAENYISDVMRQDWEANRAALLAFWRSGKYTGPRPLQSSASTSLCIRGYSCMAHVARCPGRRSSSTK